MDHAPTMSNPGQVSCFAHSPGILQRKKPWSTAMLQDPGAPEGCKWTFGFKTEEKLFVDVFAILE